jgi:hypothetical protein
MRFIRILQLRYQPTGASQLSLKLLFKIEGQQRSQAEFGCVAVAAVHESKADDDISGVRQFFVLANFSEKSIKFREKCTVGRLGHSRPLPAANRFELKLGALRPSKGNQDTHNRTPPLTTA